MRKVEYEIQRHKESGEWVLWKIVENIRQDEGCGGMSLRGIFSGTKKECQEKKREMMKNDKRRRNKNVKK